MGFRRIAITTGAFVLIKILQHIEISIHRVKFSHLTVFVIFLNTHVTGSAYELVTPASMTSTAVRNIVVTIMVEQTCNV